MATRFDDDERLIINTDRQLGTVLANYRLRWIIETLLAALKTRGFNLESTHFCQTERLDKPIVLLAIAFCWATLSDLWQHQRRPIPSKPMGAEPKGLSLMGCRSISG